MEKPPFPFHPYALQLTGPANDPDDPAIRNGRMVHDVTDPTYIPSRQPGFRNGETPDARKIRMVPDMEALRLAEVTQVVLAFSLALAEVTDCLHAFEAPEIWDPAYRDPDIALRLAHEKLLAAQDEVIRRDGHFDIANATDHALTDVGYALASAIDRRDLSPDRRQVLETWHAWQANHLRIDSARARAAFDTIQRLFYRMACYSDACLGPQVWPLELQDPDVDPDAGDLLEQIITF